MPGPHDVPKYFPLRGIRGIKLLLDQGICWALTSGHPRGEKVGSPLRHHTPHQTAASHRTLPTFHRILVLLRGGQLEDVHQACEELTSQRRQRRPLDPAGTGEAPLEQG